jgi:CheY-like chemotaxis protein
MPGSKKTVMLVDDNPDVIRLLEFVLTKKGFDVVSFLDPREAYDNLAQVSPSVILLDYIMPEMTGVEFLQKLRAETSQIKDITVLIGSGRVSDEDKERALKAGADGYICKPYVFDDLAMTLQKHAS